jgi:hypothetical protein
VALATPLVRIGEPMANAEATLALMRQARATMPSWRCSRSWGSRPTAAKIFFHQQALLKASEEALAWLLAALQEPANRRLRGGCPLYVTRSCSTARR